MARISRGIFRHSYDFVVVRRIRLSNTSFIEPGTELDKSKYRRFQLRGWWMRGRIGRVDSEWVKAMLADRYNPRARPEVTGVLKPVIPENMDENIRLLGEDIPRETFIEMTINHFDALDVRGWNSLPAEKQVEALHQFFDIEIRRRAQDRIATITKGDDGHWVIPGVSETFKTRRAAEAYVLGGGGGAPDVTDTPDAQVGGSEDV